MLSSIITNATIATQLFAGFIPFPVSDVENDTRSGVLNYQSFVVPPGVGQQVQIDQIISATKTYPSGYAPLPSTNSKLLNASLKYLGKYWDCTALVEQSLRDLGYSVPDLAPMSFGSYGKVFYDPSMIQPGDIMMNNGHVAIYAGNGMAIEGGFGFGGVVYSYIGGSPLEYSEFVRVG